MCLPHLNPLLVSVYDFLQAGMRYTGRETSDENPLLPLWRGDNNLTKSAVFYLLNLFFKKRTYTVVTV